MLPISFRVTSLALGQSCDCPSASEVTLKDMGTRIRTRNSFYCYNHAQQKKPTTYTVHILRDISTGCQMSLLNIPHTSYFVVLRFVVVWYQSMLPISSRVTSLALGQSHDCPSASEATLKNMDTRIHTHNSFHLYNNNKTKHDKTLRIFYGI